MKEYDKALETYQEGLKHDAQNQELLDGVRRYSAFLLLFLISLPPIAKLVGGLELCLTAA